MNAQYSDIRSNGGMDPRAAYEAERNPPAPRTHYKVMIVEVDIYDVESERLVISYSTDLANDQMRRVFAEQMTNVYAGGQYSIVVPSRVIPKDSAQ